MTPERIAALEAAAAENDATADAVLESMLDARRRAVTPADGAARRGRLASRRPALQPRRRSRRPARARARRADAPCRSAGRGEALGDLVPVDDVPPRVDVVGARFWYFR